MTRDPGPGVVRATAGRALYGAIRPGAGALGRYGAVRPGAAGAIGPFGASRGDFWAVWGMPPGTGRVRLFGAAFAAMADAIDDMDMPGAGIPGTGRRWPVSGMPLLRAGAVAAGRHN
jgi:hypothetical protein